MSRESCCRGQTLFMCEAVNMSVSDLQPSGSSVSCLSPFVYLITLCLSFAIHIQKVVSCLPGVTQHPPKPLLQIY